MLTFERIEDYFENPKFVPLSVEECVALVSHILVREKFDPLSFSDIDSEGNGGLPGRTLSNKVLKKALRFMVGEQLLLPPKYYQRLFDTEIQEIYEANLAEVEKLKKLATYWTQVILDYPLIKQFETIENACDVSAAQTALAEMKATGVSPEPWDDVKEKLDLEKTQRLAALKELAREAQELDMGY